MKHLEKALSLFDVPVPAVKLHLDEKGCKVSPLYLWR